MLPKEHAVWVAALNQVTPNILAAAEKQRRNIPKASQKKPEEFAASVMASPYQAPGAGGQAVNPYLAAVTSPKGIAALGRVATTVARSSRKGRARRQLVGYDEFGQAIYRTARRPRQPRGFSAAGAAGGAVTRTGGISTAGKLGAVAAGLAAYYVSSKILERVGNRALDKEEQGVEAALAFRQARADFERDQGRPPTSAEVRQMGAAYKATLAELGYDPSGVRVRTKLENFLTTYGSEEG
jgi:hypothetical protein